MPRAQGPYYGWRIADFRTYLEVVLGEIHPSKSLEEIRALKTLHYRELGKKRCGKKPIRFNQTPMNKLWHLRRRQAITTHRTEQTINENQDNEEQEEEGQEEGKE